MRTSATAWREAVATLATLMAIAFEPAAVHLRLGSRNERREAIDAAIVGGLYRWPRLTVLSGLLLLALVGLRLALMIIARLLKMIIARLLNRNEAGLRSKIRVVFAVVVTRFIRDIDVGSGLLLRLALAKLFLRRGDQAKIMLRMLIVVFGAHGIAG
jgi:hypothetical protein